MVFYDWERIKPEEITRYYRRRVAASENITVAMVEVTAGSTTRPHRHENEEVVIVLKGSWRFCLPNGDVTLRPNQMLFIPPGVEHSSEALEDTLAFDICASARSDWLTGEDRALALDYDPDECLWAV